MKRIVIRLLALGLVLLAVGACKTSFDPTNVSSSTVATVQAGLNDPRLTGVNITPTITAALTTATNQLVTLTFNNAHIDQATLTAVKFFTLSGTAAADGGRAHLADITPASPIFRYQGSNTVVIYTFDLSATASISNFIEFDIDAATLTADNGSLRLNRDGDNVVGEATEDDYVTEIAVGGTPGVTAAGNPRNPQAILPTPTLVGGSFVVGSSAIQITIAGAPTFSSASVIGSAIVVQKFNRTTLTWATVTHTDAYAAGTFTATLPAAIAAGETYQILVQNPHSIVESTTTNGYARRASLINDVATAVFTAPTSFGADATFNTGATYAFSVVFDSTFKNGYVDVTVSGIGLQGIDPTTATTTNLKLFDTSINKFVDVASISVFASNPVSTQLNNRIRMTFPASYVRQFDTYQLFIGPGVKDLGATTATTDDLFLGDWTNVTTSPFLYNIVNGTSSI